MKREKNTFTFEGFYQRLKSLDMKECDGSVIFYKESDSITLQIFRISNKCDCLPKKMLSNLLKTKK